jgi:hypothetical protein
MRIEKFKLFNTLNFKPFSFYCPRCYFPPNKIRKMEPNQSSSEKEKTEPQSKTLTSSYYLLLQPLYQISNPNRFPIKIGDKKKWRKDTGGTTMKISRRLIVTAAADKDSPISCQPITLEYPNRFILCLSQSPKSLSL